MAGKRAATSKISKDNPEGDASSEEEPTPEETGGGRKISRPVRRSTAVMDSGPSNPVANNRSNPFAILHEEGKNDSSFELLLQLRGLNHCFNESIRKKLERDPTCDLTSLLTQYESHLKTIKHRFGVPDEAGQQSVKSNEPFIPSSLPTQSSIVSFSFGKTGFEFDNSSRQPVSANLDTSKPEKPIACAFAAESKDVKPPPFAFAPSSNKPAFEFGNIGNTKSPTAENSAKPESVLSAHANTTTPFSFGANKHETPSLPPFSFSVFGADTIKNKSFLDKPTGLSFGSTNMAAEQKSESKPFPSNTTAKPFEPSPFGNKINAISASTTGQQPFQFSFASPLPSFGTVANKPEAIKSDAMAMEDEDIIPAEERTNTELIKKGIGEEDETTIIEQRAKLFALEKDNGWKDLGVAILKLNQRTDSKSRVLARSEGTGKLILNSWVTENMKVDHIEAKKDFMLLCVNPDGKLTQYLVRCKEAEHAKTFSDKLIEHIPSKKD